MESWWDHGLPCQQNGAGVSVLAISEMLVAIETLGGNAFIWREVAFVRCQEPGVDTSRVSRFC